MSDNKDAVLRAAKNLQKSKNKRPSSTRQGSEPSKKRSSRTIPFSEDHVPVVIKNLGCVLCPCPVTGNHGLYSALTQEPIFTIVYPLLLEAPESKGRLRGSRHRTLSGTSKPELIFSVLNRCFGELFPDMEPRRVTDWDLYKWNAAYYGSSIAGRAPEWSELKNKLRQHRANGGDKNAVQVNVFSEIATSKSDLALDVKDLFAPDKQTLGRDYVRDLREQAIELAKKGNLLELDSKEMEDYVSSREEESDDDSESGSDNEQE